MKFWLILIHIKFLSLTQDVLVPKRSLSRKCLQIIDTKRVHENLPICFAKQTFLDIVSVVTK